MQKINTHNKNNDISEKGQKIVAALYLATQHLSDNEPLKSVIRSRALELHVPQIDRSTTVAILADLLKSAAIAKTISEHNVSILCREMSLFAQSATDATSISGLFAESPIVSSRTHILSYKQPVATSIEKQGTQMSIKSEDKNKRQEQILSFINGRKSAVIKDISTLFPDVSEKTIQRELGTLVDTGRITKRGSKRWSIYMAI